MEAQQKCAKTKGYTGLGPQPKLPTTFPDYRETELRSDNPRDFFSSQDGRWFKQVLTNRQVGKIQRLARQIKYLWLAMLLAQYAELFVIRSVSDDELPRQLNYTLLSSDLLNSDAYESFETINRCANKERHFAGLDESLVAAAITMKVSDNPEKLRHDPGLKNFLNAGFTTNTAVC